METTLLLVALVVFAFAVSRVLARFASRFFVVSGVEYIVLGLLLGPVTSVLGPSALAELELLIAMLLGLLGMILGLRAKDAFRRPRVAVAAMFASALTLVVVGGLALLVMEMFSPGDRQTVWQVPWSDGVWLVSTTPDNLRAAATIGCCAAVSSSVLVADSSRLLRAAGPIRDRLLIHGTMSQLLALAVFGMVLASARATETADQLEIPVVVWGIGIALFGAVSGLLFSTFIGSERNETRVLVSAVGVVTFASGIGVALGVSPLVVNLIAGIFVSFTSPDAPALEKTMVRLRHPVLVLVRVFAGAAWLMPALWAWILVPVYAGARFAVRRTVTYPMTRLFDRTVARLPRMGTGLVAQGGMAGAIALSYALRFPSQAGLVLTTVLGGLILSDLWCHRAVRRVLADAGELDAVESAAVRRPAAATREPTS